jgi:hypothetical protein
VTVCVQLALFPLASVTVQVTVVVADRESHGGIIGHGGAGAVVRDHRRTEAQRRWRCNPLLVVAATLAGQVMAGAMLSCTVTVAVQLLLLPLLSVTVRVTVLVPTLEQLKLLTSKDTVETGAIVGAAVIDHARR